MANFLSDNADLLYYLDQGVDWATIASLSELGYRHEDGFRSADEALAFYREVTTMVGGFAAEHVAPHAAEIDRAGVGLEGGEVVFPPRLASVFARLAEMGLHGLTLPRELGGMNAPMLLYFINGELLARADASVMTHFGFHGGIAMAMLVLSLLEGTTELDPATGRILRTRWRDEIAEIAAGRAWGSMDITEPDAGSDMAALRTTGSRDADGRWTVSGQKIFITSGHGKYHFVVARTDGASAQPGKPAAGRSDGLDALSMFLVRAYQDLPGGGRARAVSIDRLEDKLGQHASTTAALSFDAAPADLVGAQGRGFRQMLEIMNHARLAVGFESIGLCEAALRLARGYAADRHAMGKPIDRHEMIADYLDEMETDIVGLRALAMHAAFHEEVGHKKELFGRFMPGAQKEDDASDGGDAGGLAREARAHRAASRRATPLLKYLAAEKAVEMARRCLQIHGGNGYMRDFGAEKLLRDSLVMPIYEGTSQIQALMAMKDTLTGILRAPQEFLKRAAQARWRALSARDGLERRVARLQQLALGAQQHLVTHTVTDKVKSAWSGPGKRAPWRSPLRDWDPRTDFAYAKLHAERLTRLLADQQIAEVLLAQARRHPERRVALERYLERAEPRARCLHEEITSTGHRLLARLADLDAAHGTRHLAGS
jgi:alkylation response protein AidB-like acyl-CoA dehydrogenase